MVFDDAYISMVRKLILNSEMKIVVSCQLELKWPCVSGTCEVD